MPLLHSHDREQRTLDNQKSAKHCGAHSRDLLSQIGLDHEQDKQGSSHDHEPIAPQKSEQQTSDKQGSSNVFLLAMEQKRIQANNQKQGATAKQDILPHGHRVVCENRVEQHEGKSRQDVPFSKTKPDKHRDAPAEHKGGHGHLKEKKDAYRQIDAAKERRSLKDHPNKEGVENRMVVRQPVVTMPRAPLGNAQDLVDDVV